MPIRRSALWSDPRVKPPFGAAEIDWGHPLALGLRSAWLLDDILSNVDLVSGQMALGLSAGSSPIVGGNPFGLQLSGAGTAAYTVRDFTLSTTAVSVAALVSLTAAGSYPMVFSSNNGSNGFELRTQGATGKLEFQINTVGNAGTGTTNILTTGFRSVAGTWLSTGNITTYLDGVQNGSGGGGGVTITTTSSPWAIGSRSGGTFPWTGTIQYVYIYLIELPAALVTWLATEPYAMLRPIVRRRYFVPAGAVATSRSGQGFLLTGIGY